ncbi:MAG: hypothetical protein KGL95_11565, partial [Patescibacteria group bacterium]|nr:hypothetical protein [Patescibacteria group bacterium]
GKDYIFTYGPLFQWIYSVPAIVFHVPSYVSVQLASILLSACVATSVLYISFCVSDTKTDKVLLPPILLFVVGIVPLLSENTGIRFLLPLVYACFWIKPILQKRISVVQIIFLTLLPSFFGLYVYDLFPQTLLIGCLFLLYMLLRGKESIGRKIYYSLSFIVGVIGFQVLTSLLISHSLLYTKNSLTTLSDYYYVMNTVWEAGKSNYLFVFPLILISIMLVIVNGSFLSGKRKTILLLLTITAVTQLRTALIRSDSGHILAALYPSMFLSFILLYHFAKIRRVLAALLFILLFMLIPFRDNIYAYISAKNISEIVHVIKNKQQTAFLNIYSFPKEYKIYPQLFEFIAANKGKILVYPYDSVLLNIEHTTYNTYAFQLYGYSNSVVEMRTVSQLRANPPKYIILEVDGKSTLALDGIPNFTRNPLVFMWMMEHYSATEEIGQYVILQYNANKKNQYTNASNECRVWAIVGDFRYNNISDLIKPSQFYFVFRGALRLPVKPGVNTYMVIPESNNIDALAQLFNTRLDFSTMIENQILESSAKVVSVNFLNQVTFHPDTKIYCFK